MQCLEREKDIGKAHSSVADDSAEVRITRKKDTILANSPCRENRVAAECVNVRVRRTSGRASGSVHPELTCPPLALSRVTRNGARVRRHAERAEETREGNGLELVHRSRPFPTARDEQYELL